MCLEPFGATGLFILGRGGLLLAAAAAAGGGERKEEERKKRKGGGKGWGTLEECPGSAQRPQVGSQELAFATLHHHKPDKAPGQAGRGKKDTERQPVHTSPE